VARVAILIEGPLALLLSFDLLQRGAAAHDAGLLAAGAFAVVGGPTLIAGGLRMRRDVEQPRTERSSGDAGRPVPWDWSDFILFWPGAFVAAAVLGGVVVPSVHSLDASAGADTRNAVEAVVQQATYYGGALIHLYVLAGLRRGATLEELGWRGFRWWWVLIALVAAAAAYFGAAFLEQASVHLFPSAPQTQCIAVRRDYSHSVALAVVVVCVFAPLAEESIFRGFVYGYVRRWAPIPVAVLVSGAVFSALHFELLLLLPLLAVGCILALVFQGSRSLWPGALVHALFNLPNVLILLSPTFSC